jgi:hypothetical protein
MYQLTNTASFSPMHISLKQSKNFLFFKLLDVSSMTGESKDGIGVECSFLLGVFDLGLVINREPKLGGKFCSTL